jgi:hypothetical protein
VKRFELLAEAARVRKTAMGKMRAHRKRGVELANSEFDPRVGTNAQLRTMSDKQIVSYIDRIKRFNLRGNQYYLTAKKDIVSSYRIDDFLRQQRRLDRLQGDIDKAFGHFEHLDTGERVSDYNARVRKGFDDRIYRNAQKVYGDIVHSRSDLKKLSRLQREALRFGKASTFAEKADTKKRVATGYLDTQYDKHMGMLTKMISDSSVLDSRLVRDLQGLSKKALVSLAKHSNIVERIRDAYEYEKKHDFSQLTLEGGSQRYGRASEPVRAIIHAYAKADANRTK